jgi:hypothetical protein
MIIIVYGSILQPFPNNWAAIVGAAYYTEDILLFHVTSQIVHFPSHRFAVMRPRERVANCKDRSQVVHTGPNVKIESSLH